MANFPCRDDDIWVCSFPRSGTTVTLQITYLITTMDFEKGKTVELGERCPFADMYDPSYPYFRGLKYIDDLPVTSPRIIKSHLPFHVLPEQLKAGKGKIIYITRNPKASVVSLYKLLSYVNQRPAPKLKHFVEDLLVGKSVLGAPWDKHFGSYWEHRHDENVLFIQFEQLVKDRRSMVVKIANFLGKTLPPSDVDKICQETSIESMKGNVAVNLQYYDENFQTDKEHGEFINKGDNSGWHEELPEDLVQKMDQLIQETTKDTGIVFE